MFVGLNPAGTYALANTQSGIVLDGGVNHSIERNVVGASGVDGIQLNGATDSIVKENTVGLNASRTAPLGNTRYGIYLNAGSSRNTIDKNYVSGNHFGIYVLSSNDGIITGNVVGLLGDGTTLAGNEYFGIFVHGALRTRVGTNGDGVQDDLERNVATGNWKNINTYCSFTKTKNYLCLCGKTRRNIFG